MRINVKTRKKEPYVSKEPHWTWISVDKEEACACFDMRIPVQKMVKTGNGFGEKPGVISLLDPKMWCWSSTMRLLSSWMFSVMAS